MDLAFGYIFVGICLAIYGWAFMEAHGWPWLKRFNERREQAGFWDAFVLMGMDDQKFAEWLSKKSRG